MRRFIKYVLTFSLFPLPMVN